MNLKSNPYLKSATGLEIKDWIWHNAHNDTKYTKVAKTLLNKFNIEDTKFYMVVRCFGKTSLIEVDENNKHYEFPCDH